MESDVVGLKSYNIDCWWKSIIQYNVPIPRLYSTYPTWCEHTRRNRQSHHKYCSQKIRWWAGAVTGHSPGIPLFSFQMTRLQLDPFEKEKDMIRSKAQLWNIFKKQWNPGKEGSAPLKEASQKHWFWGRARQIFACFLLTFSFRFPATKRSGYSWCDVSNKTMAFALVSRLAVPWFHLALLLFDYY